jgi:hypothetical protein
MRYGVASQKQSEEAEAEHHRNDKKRTSTAVQKSWLRVEQNRSL